MPPKRPSAEEPRKRVRGPRTPRWSKEGDALAAILDERGIGQTEFAERLGRKFHTVHRWCNGFEFTPDNQSEAARELGLPPDAFTKCEPLNSPRSSAHYQRAYTRAVLMQFTARCPIATSLTNEEWRVLRSMRFPDATLRPSVGLFEAVAFALKGAIRLDEVLDVAAENTALDASLARKPPLRRTR